MNPRTIGYIRVSTAGQATDGVSIDAQTARIRAWYYRTKALIDNKKNKKYARSVSGAKSFRKLISKKPLIVIAFNNEFSRMLLGDLDQV